MRWAALLLMLLVVPSAAAKEGVTAELLSTVPTDAQPGTKLELSWKLTTADGKPFGAMGVFVRLVDRAGKTVDVTAPQSHGPFFVTARVPVGGLGGIRIGLHGTTDIFFPVANDPFAYRHPLRLPRLARGAPCPVSTPPAAVDFHAYGIGEGIGDGPAFPVGMATGTLEIAPAPNFGSRAWGGQKVLWFVLPSYTGPVLIRGARLDAKGEVRFERGSLPPKELFLPPYDGPRDRPSYTRLQGPGCYAYQVDGIGFSTVVVFRAVRA